MGLSKDVFDVMVMPSTSSSGGVLPTLRCSTTVVALEASVETSVVSSNKASLSPTHSRRAFKVES